MLFILIAYQQFDICLNFLILFLGSFILRSLDEEFDFSREFQRKYYATILREGIRVLWNGKDLYYANGRKIERNLPENIVKSLGILPLDGFIRSKNHSLSQIFDFLNENSENNHGNLDWNSLELQILDAPSTSRRKFESRLEQLKDLFFGENSFVQISSFQSISTKEKLEEYVKSSNSKNLFGIILIESNSYYHQPNALYVIKVIIILILYR